MQYELRPALSRDAEMIAAIYRPIVETTAISFEEVAPDAAEFSRRIAEITRTYPWLVAEIDGTVVGYAYASRHRERAGYRHSVDVSAYVAQSARGQGIGTALYGRLLRELREREFHAAFAGITLPNDASISLHRRAGFEPVGIYKEVGRKFDRWLDVSWWQRTLQA